MALSADKMCMLSTGTSTYVIGYRPARPMGGRLGISKRHSEHRGHSKNDQLPVTYLGKS